MGLLYDLVQDIAGREGVEQGYFECWINWKISAPLIQDKDNSDDTNLEIVSVNIDSTHSIDVWIEPPLEIEFKSLASNKPFRGPLLWKIIW